MRDLSGSSSITRASSRSNLAAPLFKCMRFSSDMRGRSRAGPVSRHRHEPKEIANCLERIAYIICAATAALWLKSNLPDV